MVRDMHDMVSTMQSIYIWYQLQWCKNTGIKIDPCLKS